MKISLRWSLLRIRRGDTHKLAESYLVASKLLEALGAELAPGRAHDCERKVPSATFERNSGEIDNEPSCERAVSP